MDWWYVVRRYTTPQQAKEDFDRINGIAAKQKGEAQIAGYRIVDILGNQTPRVVVVLGHKEEKVRESAREMKGRPYRVPPGFVRGLIARRIRWLADHADQPSGVYREHIPYGRMVHPDGTVTELEGDDE